MARRVLGILATVGLCTYAAGCCCGGGGCGSGCSTGYGYAPYSAPAPACTCVPAPGYGAPGYAYNAPVAQPVQPVQPNPNYNAANPNYQR